MGKFAERAGVSVRTLQYYDKIGLMKPSAYSEHGRRLYSDQDVARLQQILTLKFIGLTLEEIRSLLTSDQVEMAALLARQQQVLKQQAQHLAAVIQTIEQALATLQLSKTMDLEQLIMIIKAVNMHNHADWFDQLLTPQQRDKLAIGGTLADQQQIGEAWKQLFEDVQAHMMEDIRHPEVQKLVDRWDALMGDYTQGDAELQQQLHTAYLQMGELLNRDSASAAQDYAQTLHDAAEFIQRARAARGD
ncbi:MAG: MerR family transcriptional regulator [Anaerolineae bacterium]|nr:MerR family transcriptional regulator [Anaerolineae bacterium]